MINANQNSRSYTADVSVSSAILDKDFVSRSALWQVVEGTNYISNGNQFEDIQYDDHNSSKASLRLGQFSNSSGVFIYKLCSPGTMIFGNECIMCNAGYFSATGRPDSCKICAPGYFSAVNTRLPVLRNSRRNSLIVSSLAARALQPHHSVHIYKPKRKSHAKSIHLLRRFFATKLYQTIIRLYI